MRTLDTTERSQRALDVLGVLHGLHLADADAVLAEARSLATCFVQIDAKHEMLLAARAALDVKRAQAAADERRAQYIEKANATGLQERLQNMNGGRASSPSLAELEAEFGREFV